VAELARSNADLEQFAYVVSHDLREPLRAVTSYLQLLEKQYAGQLDEKADKFIAYAVGGAIRMQELISGLLAYSRVGTRAEPFGLVDCESILDNALTDLRISITERHAVVTRDPLPMVVADDVQLRQVFQNLIGNAIKFCREEPPLVHVSAKRVGDNWVFAVRDNGIGIDPAQTERIFGVFQRLHTPEEYPGTGMGLPICKRIVERHGGRIWVQSSSSQGSTFCFTVPFQESSSA
jgi:light-regulated signal transduction histidine kinase (bacteriophytochrome)